MSQIEKSYLFNIPAATPNYGMLPISSLSSAEEKNTFIIPLQCTEPWLTSNKDYLFGYTVPIESEPRPVINPNNCDFENGTFVVYDIETTGLPSQFNEITEIGAVKITLKNGKVIKREEFQKFGKTSFPIPEFIKKLTHITDEMLEKDGVSQQDLIKSFCDFCGNAPCVGHNIINFDSRFINKQCEKLNLYKTVNGKKIPLFNNPQADTMHIDKMMHKRKAHKLQTMVQDGLSLSEEMLENYISKAQSNSLNPAIKDEKIINDNLKDFLKIVNKKTSIQTKIKELSEHNIFKQLKFTYDLKYQHRAIADVIVNAEVFIQQCIPYFKKLGIKNFKEINTAAAKNFDYLSQQPLNNVIIFCDDNMKSKLIETEQFEKVIDLNNINRKNVIITNNPSSQELIDSSINDSLDQLKSKILKYDFISLPPPSFWTLYLSKKIQERWINLDLKTDKFLYEHRKELAQCVSNVSSDDKKIIHALQSSKIFGNLSLPHQLDKIKLICSKIRFLIDPFVKFNVNKYENRVYVTKTTAPDLTLEQLQEAYKRIIDVAVTNGIKVVIDNEIYAPDISDMQELKTHFKNNFDKPYSKFVNSELGCRFFKYSPAMIRKELSFLKDKDLIEDMIINNSKEIYKKINQLNSNKKLSKHH